MSVSLAAPHPSLTPTPNAGLRVDRPLCAEASKRDRKQRPLVGIVRKAQLGVGGCCSSVGLGESAPSPAPCAPPAAASWAPPGWLQSGTRPPGSSLLTAPQFQETGLRARAGFPDSKQMGTTKSRKCESSQNILERRSPQGGCRTSRLAPGNLPRPPCVSSHAPLPGPSTHPSVIPRLTCSSYGRSLFPVTAKCFTRPSPRSSWSPDNVAAPFLRDTEEDTQVQGRSMSRTVTSHMKLFRFN